MVDDDRTSIEGPLRTEIRNLLELYRHGSPAPNLLKLGPKLAQIDTAAFIQFGRIVAEHRRQLGKEVESAFTSLQELHAQLVLENQGALSPLESPGSSQGLSPSMDPMRRAIGKLSPLIGRRNGDVERSSRPAYPDKSVPQTPFSTRQPGTLSSKTSTSAIGEIVDWGLSQGKPELLEPVRLGHSIQSLLRSQYPLAVDSSLELLPTWLRWLSTRTEESANAFEQQFKIEPIGRLHLERMEMTPVGIERGELVYSVPLAPLERVNISHKEWSLRTEEFETIVQDVLEDFSEEGLTEKSDLSQSSESQQRHTSAFSLSGQYSGYGASVSIGYNTTSDDLKASKESLDQSRTLTRKASSRSKRDHKHSFKVTSVVGAEDKSVRVIRNPNADKAVRIDYYQLMRKWRVDLYRYGLRMTYDIVIPSPGRDLMQKLIEIRSIEDELAKPFTFLLRSDEITRDNWDTKAMEYGANISPPPDVEKEIYLDEAISWRLKEDSEAAMVETIDFDTGSDYAVEWGSLEGAFGRHNDEKVSMEIAGEQFELTYNSENIPDRVYSDLENTIGKTGEISILYEHKWVSHGWIKVTIGMKLKDEAFRRWTYLAWNTMREAAETKFFQDRQTLTQTVQALRDAVGSWDALTLRHMEREEIMKEVLQWILGPSFQLVPSQISELFEPYKMDGWTGSTSLKFLDLDDEKWDDDEWERVIRFGEMIKFLHQAIEWENVIYFTYPYFWDSPGNWDFKRFLQHPDSRHREFLRSGSARVVLTIRPGYETAFADFVELGALGNKKHPYLEIAKEIQAFASTNYAGIASANPEDEARPLLSEAQRAAWTKMRSIIEKLEEHREYSGQYPTTEEGLAILPNFDGASSKDPWGKPFIYKSPGVYSEFELSSLGADGQQGGEGEDADITSWAEASLVGRWFEYTPTNALDISIDTNLGGLA
jgi:hypothetical protein